MKLNPEKKVVLKPYKVFNEKRPPKYGWYIVIIDGEPNYIKVSYYGYQQSYRGIGWEIDTEVYGHKVTHYAPVPKLYATNKVVVYK